MNLAVLMCVYGGDDPSYFEAALNSIEASISNDNNHLRVYIHIDGDVSPVILSLINECPIMHRIVKSEDNIGLAAGLNKLIALLEDEEYIFRMDADDIVVKGRFSSQIEYMERELDVDFSGGGICEFEGDVSGVDLSSARFYPSKHSEIIDTIVKGSPFAHVTMCFRKGFFQRFGCYPTEYPLNEDIAYWFKAIRAGAIGANIQKTLVFVRMDMAYSRRSLRKAFPEFKVYCSIVQWARRGWMYPFIRLLFRILPSSIVKYLYRSRFRTIILGQGKNNIL